MRDKRYLLPLALLMGVCQLAQGSTKDIPSNYVEGADTVPPADPVGGIDLGDPKQLVFRATDGGQVMIPYDRIIAATARLEVQSQSEKLQHHFLSLRFRAEDDSETTGTFWLDRGDAWEVINSVEHRIPSGLLEFEGVDRRGILDRAKSMRKLAKRLGIDGPLPATMFSLLPRDPDPDKARIYFTRKSSMLGAAGEHLVVDRRGASMDAILLQK